MTTPAGQPPSSTQRRQNARSSGSERRDRHSGVPEHPFGAVKAQQSALRTPMQRVADRLTRIASSPLFLVVHVVWLAAWIAVNSGMFGSRAFDEFPFGLLTLILSIEAIFLTIFVLMSQGRESVIAELREEMTLQVNLRIESEVTKTLQLVAGLYSRLDAPLGDEPELRDMLRPLDPDAIKKELEVEIGDEDGSRARKGETKVDDAKVDVAKVDASGVAGSGAAGSGTAGSGTDEGG